MSFSHHGQSGEPDENQLQNMQRLVDQLNGTARRAYPAGRMGAEDDGVLSYAIATDTQRSVIAIRFGKPVEWVGLGIDEATSLRDQLTERIMELRGITA